MDKGEIYKSMLSYIEHDLLLLSYRRSGKGILFYRYGPDKQVACGIEMQKSLFSSDDRCVFTFNSTCIAIYHVSPRPKQLTLAHIKAGLRRSFERTGPSYPDAHGWWEITEEYLQEYGLEGYYDRFMRKDILDLGMRLNGRMKDMENKLLGKV